MSKQHNQTLSIGDDNHITIEQPINWNKGVDELDALVWSKLVSQFWVPEAIALSSDKTSWNAMSQAEKDAVTKVFTSLAGLDTLQGSVGALSLIPDARTPHEIAVLTNIAFMERMHGDTELLTPQGWKTIKEITEQDLVLQYSPETHSLSFAHPIKTYSSFSPQNYKFTATKHLQGTQIVSAGHRMYYEMLEDEKWVSKTAEAEQLIDFMGDANYRFRVGASMVNESNETISRTSRQTLALWALGAKASDKQDTVTFQMLLHDYDALYDLFVDSVDATLTSTETSSDTDTDVVTAHLQYSGAQTQLSPNFSALHDANIASEAWSMFLHYRMTNKSQQYRIFSQEDYDTCVVLASLNGCSIEKVSPDDSMDLCYVQVSQEPYISFRDMNVTEVEPQMMYCVQVPSTYLYTRYQGSIAITGNCIHAKSYSSIAATLISTKENDEAFAWFAKNETTQYKIKRVTEFYYGKDPLMRKAASTLLESFLFYSGFFLPLWLSSRGKLVNTSDLIKLIMRDEAVHGYYIGAVAQESYENFTDEEFNHYDSQVRELLRDLFDNEMKFTKEIYEPLGLVDEVEAYLKYNANRALMNLGLEVEFSDEEAQVKPEILAAMSGEVHDFFSTKGNTYKVPAIGETTDDDWDWDVDDEE